MGGTCYYCKSKGIVSKKKVRQSRNVDFRKLIPYISKIMEYRYHNPKVADFEELEIKYISYDPWKVAHFFDMTKNRHHNGTHQRIIIRKERQTHYKKKSVL